MIDKSYNYSNKSHIVAPTLYINLILFTATACFTLSLFMPVFFTSADDIYGYWVMAIGWGGIIFGQFAWYANTMILLALLLAHRQPLTALLLALLSLVLASDTFLFTEIPVGINNEIVFVQELGIGFYIWYLSHILFLFAILLRHLTTDFNK